MQKTVFYMAIYGNCMAKSSETGRKTWQIWLYKAVKMGKKTAINGCAECYKTDS